MSPVIYNRKDGAGDKESNLRKLPENVSISATSAEFKHDIISVWDLWLEGFLHLVVWYINTHFYKLCLVNSIIDIFDSCIMAVTDMYDVAVSAVRLWQGNVTRLENRWKEGLDGLGEWDMPMQNYWNSIRHTIACPRN